MSRRPRSPPPNPEYSDNKTLPNLNEDSEEDLAEKADKYTHRPSSDKRNTREHDSEPPNESYVLEEIPLLTTQEEFIHAIKKWVATDNQLRVLNARVKEAREHRNLITQQIHQYVEDRNLDYPSIEISDGELILCEKREYSSLTFSYIDKCLSQLIKEPAHVDRIMNVLRENRECYIVPDIRRSQRKSSSSSSY
jgi:hypothetical protein